MLYERDTTYLQFDYNVFKFFRLDKVEWLRIRIFTEKCCLFVCMGFGFRVFVVTWERNGPYGFLVRSRSITNVFYFFILMLALLVTHTNRNQQTSIIGSHIIIILKTNLNIFFFCCTTAVLLAIPSFHITWLTNRTANTYQPCSILYA